MFKRRKVVDQSLESSVLQDLKASLLQAIAKDVPQEENQASFSTRSGPFPELGFDVSAPSTDSFSAEVANRIIQCDDHGEVDALVTSLVNSPDFVRPVFVRVSMGYSEYLSIRRFGALSLALRDEDLDTKTREALLTSVCGIATRHQDEEVQRCAMALLVEVIKAAKSGDVMTLVCAMVVVQVTSTLKPAELAAAVLNSLFDTYITTAKQDPESTIGVIADILLGDQSLPEAVKLFQQEFLQHISLERIITGLRATWQAESLDWLVAGPLIRVIYQAEAKYLLVPLGGIINDAFDTNNVTALTQSLLIAQSLLQAKFIEWLKPLLDDASGARANRHMIMESLSDMLPYQQRDIVRAIRTLVDDIGSKDTPTRQYVRHAKNRLVELSEQANSDSTYNVYAKVTAWAAEHHKSGSVPQQELSALKLFQPTTYAAVISEILRPNAENARIRFVEALGESGLLPAQKVTRFVVSNKPPTRSGAVTAPAQAPSKLQASQPASQVSLGELQRLTSAASLRSDIFVGEKIEEALVPILTASDSTREAAAQAIYSATKAIFQLDDNSPTGASTPIVPNEIANAQLLVSTAMGHVVLAEVLVKQLVTEASGLATCESEGLISQFAASLALCISGKHSNGCSITSRVVDALHPAAISTGWFLLMYLEFIKDNFAWVVVGDSEQLIPIVSGRSSRLHCRGYFSKSGAQLLHWYHRRFAFKCLSVSPTELSPAEKRLSRALTNATKQPLFRNILSTANSEIEGWMLLEARARTKDYLTSALRLVWVRQELQRTFLVSYNLVAIREVCSALASVALQRKEALVATIDALLFATHRLRTAATDQDTGGPWLLEYIERTLADLTNDSEKRRALYQLISLLPGSLLLIGDNYTHINPASLDRYSSVLCAHGCELLGNMSIEKIVGAVVEAFDITFNARADSANAIKPLQSSLGKPNLLACTIAANWPMVSDAISRNTNANSPAIPWHKVFIVPQSIFNLVSVTMANPIASELAQFAQAARSRPYILAYTLKSHMLTCLAGSTDHLHSGEAAVGIAQLRDRFYLRRLISLLNTLAGEPDVSQFFQAMGVCLIDAIKRHADYRQSLLQVLASMLFLGPHVLDQFVAPFGSPLDVFRSSTCALNMEECAFVVLESLHTLAYSTVSEALLCLDFEKQRTWKQHVRQAITIAEGSTHRPPWAQVNLTNLRSILS